MNVREIKFRGKGIDNGEWVYGSLLIDSDVGSSDIVGYEYYSTVEGHQRDPFSTQVDPETVGQYTGLKDEEGKEIYEGDYLWAKGNNTDELQPVGMVVWDDKDARFEVTSLNGRFEYIPDGCVVRRENPELLEETK